MSDLHTGLKKCDKEFNHECPFEEWHLGVDTNESIVSEGNA